MARLCLSCCKTFVFPLCSAEAINSCRKQDKLIGSGCETRNSRAERKKAQMGTVKRQPLEGKQNSGRPAQLIAIEIFLTEDEKRCRGGHCGRIFFTFQAWIADTTIHFVCWLLCSQPHCCQKNTTSSVPLADRSHPGTF